MGYISKSEGPKMSTNGDLKVLEEMILGSGSSTNASYVIFLTGEAGEVPLPSEYLIELLLLFDSGIFDLETLSMLFDVSIQDIATFTEDNPGYWGMWEESIATMWTKALRFYEDDLEKLSWIAKYAVKRAELAVAMKKTLIVATQEMDEELNEDAGWTEENSFMRLEGIMDRQKRSTILKDWFWRAHDEEEEEDGKYQTT